MVPGLLQVILAYESRNIGKAVLGQGCDAYSITTLPLCAANCQWYVSHDSHSISSLLPKFMLMHLLKATVLYYLRFCARAGIIYLWQDGIN